MKFILSLLCTLISVQSFSQQIVWTSEQEVALPSDGNLHPRISVNNQGQPLIIWGKASSNECRFSRWNGSTFSSPLIVNPPSIPVFTASWAGPDIASKGDTIYIVFKETPEDVNSIYIVSSFDGGLSFSSPSQVDFIAPDVSRFPTVTIDESGNPIVGFMKFDSNFSNARWVVVRSADYGNTFSSDVLASGWSGGDVCDCCPASIVSQSNTVALLYRDNLSNLRDSWAGISYDNGVTFSGGWNIDQNNWMLQACPSTGPDGVIINDTLYSVFMNGASGSPKVYFSSSSIDSMQTALVIQLSGNNSQNYPRVSSFNSALGVVWKETISGLNHGLIRFSSDINAGLSNVVDTIANEGVENIDIAVFNGIVYVVWQDDVSGTIKFRTGNFTPTSSITSFESTSGRIYPNPVSANEIHIVLSGEQNGDFNYEIENLLGQPIVSNQFHSVNGKATINFLLKPGFYILRIPTENSEMNFKFIKE